MHDFILEDTAWDVDKQPTLPDPETEAGVSQHTFILIYCVMNVGNDSCGR